MEQLRFNGVLAVEGQEANGVVLEPGSLSWPEEGVPLVLWTTRGGVERAIGKVEQIERVGDEIRGEVIVDTAALEGEGRPFEIDDDGIVGFGLAAHISFPGSPFGETVSGGVLTAVAATAEPAYPSARASRAVPPPDKFPHRPDHRLRDVVSFTLPSTGERWHWPIAKGDGAAIDALCEILDRAGVPWSVSRG
jgi:hypothetical protein